ncbi:MAG: response regulator, partial [Proteobacteria bacterium]|nr:response regulator [Pseudomonadota bacterium]
MNGKPKTHESVLVVDDDPNILDTFRDSLSVLGYEVATLSSGAKAIDYLSKNIPSCAIIDMVMPEMSGLDLIDYIRDHFPYLPFIAVSGLAEINIVKTAMQKGAYDYLVKPVKITDLAMTVKRAIERGKLLKENIEYRNLLEQKVNEQTKYIKNMFIRAINSMIKALEARDVYT